MGTFYRPNLRPYFLVTSSIEVEEGEEDDDGFWFPTFLFFEGTYLKAFQVSRRRRKRYQWWHMLITIKLLPNHKCESDSKLERQRRWRAAIWSCKKEDDEECGWALVRGHMRRKKMRWFETWDESISKRMLRKSL